MKILFTGATGVLGRAALPRLVAEGHDVTAVARNTEDHPWLESLGARPAAIDLFDADSIEAAMAGTDTVVHYATSIPALTAMAKRDSWTMNDRLRSEATGLLVDAAVSRGVGRFVQESITFVYADGGSSWLDERSPVAPTSDVLDSALVAEAHVDRFRGGGGTGVTLRLSRVYGPGKASDEHVAAVAARRIPIVGDGENFVSSLHVDDAATALATAMTAPDGVYNVTDDVPVTAAEHIETLARVLGAPRPRRIPAPIGRLGPGRAAGMLTTSHRVSNRRFRETTGWAPTFPSVDEGWRDVVRRNG